MGLTVVGENAKKQAKATQRFDDSPPISTDVSNAIRAAKRIRVENPTVSKHLGIAYDATHPIAFGRQIFSSRISH